MRIGPGTSIFAQRFSLPKHDVVPGSGRQCFYRPVSVGKQIHSHHRISSLASMPVDSFPLLKSCFEPGYKFHS